MKALTLAVALSIGMASAALAAPQHGLSVFGDLKYPADFSHFDYVNPDAPKNGQFSTYDLGSFDSLNPFILKGQPIFQHDGDRSVTLLYDSLMVRAYDEPDALYGLAAHSVEVAVDKSWAEFHLREQARFHDGHPLRAEDVAFSFTTLVEKGHPSFRLSLRDVSKVSVIDPLTIRFEFTGESVRDLPMRVAVLPILPKHYWQGRDFAKSTLEPPLSGGPYKFGQVEAGRYFILERVKDHWASDLPVLKGQYNFDRIRVDFYRDRTATMEAFKAGDYEFREEYTSKTWATEYDFPAMKAGLVNKERIRDYRPSGIQGFFLNTRRARFADVRVRRALDLAFDFEWMNRTLFYDSYARTDSMFVNTDLKAQGAPTVAELALLEPFRDQLDPAVFGPAYLPPRTDGSGKVRKNLRAATRLLKQAGWHIADGVLVNDAGEPFTIEFLGFQPSTERVVSPFVKNLEKLGIQARVRLVDSAQFKRRLDEFDYDSIIRRFGLSDTPGVELRQMFSSAAADAVGAYNQAGIKDPVVDALIETIVSAKTRDDLKVAAAALDRVLMHGSYMVPQWYSGHHRLAYWDKFGQPDNKPKYDRGVYRTWWVDPDKAAALKAKK